MRDEDVRQRARITINICNRCSNRLTKEELISIMKQRGDEKFTDDYGQKIERWWRNLDKVTKEFIFVQFDLLNEEKKDEN